MLLFPSPNTIFTPFHLYYKEGERTKYDDKILEYVLSNEVEKLRSAIEKKKYSALNLADERGRIP